MPRLKTAIAVTIMLSALLLQGCGRKGPLFIQQAPVKPAPVAPAQPDTEPGINTRKSP